MKATPPAEILKSPSAATVGAEKEDSDEEQPFTTFETLIPRRRGRPLGSRNKRKSPNAVLPLSKKDRNAFNAVGVTPNELIVVTASTNDPNPHAEIVRDGRGLSKEGTEHPKRERLRERSKILRRYVWETEAKAGERVPSSRPIEKPKKDFSSSISGH